MPRLTKNSDVRPREYLKLEEIYALAAGAAQRREGVRDRLAIDMLFNHALRVSELCSLLWSQVDLDHGAIHIYRNKGGKAKLQPIDPIELKQLRRWQARQRKEIGGSIYIFTNSKGAPLNRRQINYIVADAGKRARIPFAVHPHMLRHSKGFNLVNRGKDIRLIAEYMGHQNMNTTMLYTQIDLKSIAGFEKRVD